MALFKSEGLRVRTLSTWQQFEGETVTGDYPGNPPRMPLTDFNVFVLSKGENSTGNECAIEMTHSRN